MCKLKFAFLVLISFFFLGCVDIDDKKIIVDETIEEVVILTKSGTKTHKYKGELNPFINSKITPPIGYEGTTFKLKHDYPESLPPIETFPWKTVTGNGAITSENAKEYVEVLKEYVGGDMRKLLFGYKDWDAENENWWQSIWLGTQREPIHGMYVGSEFDAHTLAEQDANLTTFVYTLFDKRAAVTLNKIWGTDLEGAENPKLNNADNAQYAEGSVVIKFSFVTASGNEWPPMKDAAPWTIFSNIDPNTGSTYENKGAELREVYLMQFDIIVKDSQAAPKTGWVFSTLVYDKDADGKDAWDKMIPLGATWGNNPEVVNTNNSAIIPPVTVDMALTENWINMKTPEYARSTLGWGGRLSGPNDGAVVDNATTQSGKKYKAIATVGCLACHSSAQYTQKSFLLPTIAFPSSSGFPPLYDPGSDGWMKWFQDRDGKTPMDEGEGQIGLDYGMVTSFKAIPMWQAAMKTKKEASDE